MDRRGIESLPLHPEERTTETPTAEQVLRHYSLVERHDLRAEETLVRSFEPTLTPLQHTILELPGVPTTVYTK